MTTKQAIFEAIEQLPEHRLADVLRYVQQLARTQKSPDSNPLNCSSDPLANFIGAVSHGSLAANLDNELMVVMQECSIVTTLTEDAHSTHVGIGFELLP